MGKIRELLKGLFPMPAQSWERRMGEMEDGLRSISAAQEALAARLEKLQDTAEETRVLQERAQRDAAGGAHTLDVWAPGAVSEVDGGAGRSCGKLDREGAEWPVLRELDEEVLKHFSQIVFEFHSLTDMRKEDGIRQAMEKLNRTHQLVHLHANNFGTYRLLGGAILPELLEGTYLLRSEYEFGGRPESVTTELDEINCPYLADIHLGKWEV